MEKFTNVHEAVAIKNAMCGWLDFESYAKTEIIRLKDEE